MAKAPVPGKVKTRLAKVFGQDRAADLARAMLGDTIESLRGLSWARTVLATTDPDAPVMREIAGGLELWDQGTGDLGARLERVVRRALVESQTAIAVGADSPGLPVDRLAEARRLLDDHDAALGPCDDGGYYLIGLTRCPDGLLSNLPWSQPDTLARTRLRLEERAFTVALTEPWFDVDVPADLNRLAATLRAGGASAPRTARLLEEIL